MARQLGAVRFIGRLANTVGYKARDGKGDAFDAVRSHTVEVANPQTISQMSQRMKLTPVQNFYRGLQGLLDHSWQGVKYGNPSRLHFYSIAMSRLNTSGVPYVLKGERKFVPWSFPISSGSIPVKLVPTVADDGIMKLPIWGNDGTSSIANFSTQLIERVLGVKEGMQITVVFIYDIDGEFVPLYRRFIVNTSSTSDGSDEGIKFFPGQGEDDLSGVALFAADGETVLENTLVACGIIVSALVNDVWQRNNATLVIADSLRTQYNSQAAFNAMLESYRSAKNTNSDWYLNDGDSDSGSAVSTIKEVTAEVGSIETTFAYYKIGATKYVPYFVDGEGISALAKTYRKDSDYAFTKTGASSLGVATAISDTTAEFAAAGYSLVTRSDLLALAPELTIPA